MPFESAGAFAGAAGVGALCFLGIFLFLDGRAPGVFPTVEFYAKTATWGIVAAVPVLAVTYVAGLLAIAASCGVLEWGFGGLVGRGATDVAHFLSVDKDSPVSQLYLQLRQEQGILAGSGIGMLLLSAGIASERRNLPHNVGPAIRWATWLAALGAVMCLYGGFEKGRAAHALAAEVSTAVQAAKTTARP